MVTLNPAFNPNPTGRELLRLTGGFVAVSSLVAGLLVLFVIPGACSFLGGLQLVIITILFVLGCLGFLIGHHLVRRQK